MDRTAPGTTPSTNPTAAGTGTGTEFRSVVAGASMERRPQAHARTAPI